MPHCFVDFLVTHSQVLTCMGTDRLTDEEADFMIKIADRDGDGVLEYDEIVAVLAADH